MAEKKRKHIIEMIIDKTDGSTTETVDLDELDISEIESMASTFPGLQEYYQARLLDEEN